MYRTVFIVVVISMSLLIVQPGTCSGLQMLSVPAAGLVGGPYMCMWVRHNLCTDFAPGRSRKVFHFTPVPTALNCSAFGGMNGCGGANWDDGSTVDAVLKRLAVEQSQLPSFWPLSELFESIVTSMQHSWLPSDYCPPQNARHDLDYAVRQGACLLRGHSQTFHDHPGGKIAGLSTWRLGERGMQEKVRPSALQVSTPAVSLPQ